MPEQILLQMEAKPSPHTLIWKKHLEDEAEGEWQPNDDEKWAPILNKQ